MGHVDGEEGEKKTLFTLMISHSKTEAGRKSVVPYGSTAVPYVLHNPRHYDPLPTTYYLQPTPHYYPHHYTTTIRTPHLPYPTTLDNIDDFVPDLRPRRTDNV